MGSFLASSPTVFLCQADCMLPTFHVPYHLFPSYIRRGSARFRFGFVLVSFRYRSIEHYMAYYTNSFLAIYRRSGSA